MNVEKNVYDKEVSKIVDIEKNKDIQKKFDKAYELSQQIHNVEDRKEVHRLVNEILEYLFKDKVSTSYSIPMEFIESPMGTVLFSLKFGVAEDVFTTAEITAIMDITRALISHDLRENNISGVKKGKNIIVYERDLINYMRSKDMKDTEIRMRIDLYNQYKDEGMKDEEIQAMIREEIKKYKKG